MCRRFALAAVLALAQCVGQCGAAAAAAAEEGTCPAGAGPGCSIPAGKELKCVKFRQTGGCSPRGDRERGGDKDCSETIESGTSGYCQCGINTHKVRAREATCDHRPFNCATECLQWRRYTCLGWRQTGGCSADGVREPNNDQSCDAQIGAGMSGFCECGDGRIIRKPGCKHGEFEEPFTCNDECAAEPGLYEELEIDSGASEKVIKQAFRKLSLKFHPDKTRGDRVLAARFASIREAYDIIGNPEQKAIYDSAGLKMVVDAKNNKVESGPDSQSSVEVSLETMYNGGDFPYTVQRKVICRGCRDSTSARCRLCRTACAHETEMVNVRMGPMVMQQQQKVPSKEKCRYAPTTVDVGVERGMSNGDTIVFKGMGEVQPKKVPGNLIMKIKEKKHDTFRRIGVDLHTETNLTLKEALFGFSRKIKHLDGRTIHVNYEGVTKPLAIMRITGEGMPHKGDPTQHGNLFIKCQITMPEDGMEWLKTTYKQVMP